MALKNSWTTGETFTASDANNVATEILGINASGVYASLPTVGHPGRLYFCTDIDLTLRDNGTTWDILRVGSDGPAPTAPPSASWSTTTLGSATFAAGLGGRLLTTPSAAGENLRVEYRTLTPSSNYTFTAHLEHISAFADSSYSGIVLRNSSSGSMIMFGPDLLITASGFARVRVTKWTNATTYSADYGTAKVSYTLPGGVIPKWYRIRDDATNRYFEHSINGVDWLLFHSIGRTDFITPDQVGWGASNSTGSTSLTRLRSWSVV